jgi:hypothetical protein
MVELVDLAQIKLSHLNLYLNQEPSYAIDMDEPSTTTPLVPISVDLHLRLILAWLNVQYLVSSKISLISS